MTGSLWASPHRTDLPYRSHGDKFVIGDVIRWIEPIWRENKNRRKARKSDKLGTRRLTAEVRRVDARGYVSLSQAMSIYSRRLSFGSDEARRRG